MTAGTRRLVAVCSLAMVLLSAGVAAAAEKVAVIAAGVNFINLNPLTHRISVMRVANNLLFDGLTKFDDGSYQPKPDLAESWTVSRDGLEYVFKLRRNVVFHDGSAFSAHDVKFSWEVICHKDNVRMADVYNEHFAGVVRGCREYHDGKAERVDGIQVVDDHTLRVRLVETYAPFLLSTTDIGVLPRAKYGSIPVKDLLRHPLSRAPIGTGPFMFVEWKEGDRVVLKANPRYFLGKPKLDGLVIRYIPDPAARIIELKNGTLHFAFFAPVPTEDFTAAKGDARVVSKTFAGLWNYVFITDQTNPLFRDVRVRRAIDHAFDRKKMLADIWGGYGTVSNSVINPGLPAFNPNVAMPEYDVAKSRALLREAGWTPGADGVLQKDGQRFEFSIVTFPGPTKTMAIVYQEYLKRIGMETKVDTVDIATLFGVRLHPGKFEAISFNWGPRLYPDPGVGLYAFMCANTRTGYCSTESDALITRGARTHDVQERIRTYWKLQELYARDLPFIWTVMPSDLQFASPKLVLPDRPTDFLTMKSILEWDLKD